MTGGNPGKLTWADIQTFISAFIKLKKQQIKIYKLSIKADLTFLI